AKRTWPGQRNRYPARACRYAWSEPPALQPHHAEQDDNAGPEPVANAVLRAAVTARAMMHGEGQNLVTTLLHERRQEAVHVVERRELEVIGAIEHLEPAARVTDAVVQQPATRGVGDTRRDAAQPAIVPLAAFPDHHARAGQQKCGEQRGNVGGIVLPVPVENGHDRRTGAGHTGTDCSALPPITPVLLDPYLVPFFVQARSFSYRVV